VLVESIKSPERNSVSSEACFPSTVSAFKLLTTVVETTVKGAVPSGASE